jgi:hypothetical protein
MPQAASPARRHGRRSLLGWPAVAFWGVLGLTTLLLCAHVKVYGPLSPVDEIQHADYALHLMHGDLLAAGDQFTPEGQNILACRGIDTAPPQPNPCGGPHDLSLSPGGGYDTAYVHPPFYYLLPAAAAWIGQAVAIEGDLMNVMRLTSVLWWAVFVGIAWRLFRELGVHRWARAAGLLLLIASPVVLQTHSAVNNDVTALPAGAAMTLAALLWDRGALQLRWVALLATAAVVLKTTNLVVVMAVALFMLVRYWQRLEGGRGRWWQPPGRVLGGVAALGAVSVAVIVGWTVIAGLIQVVDPRSIPQTAAFYTPEFRPVWMATALYSFVTPLDVEFINSVLTSDWTTSLGVITNLGLLVLAVCGAARAEAGSPARALAISIGVAALAFPALLVVSNYVTAHMSVAITSRYGLSLVPAMLAIGLTSIRPRPVRIGFAVFAVGACAVMGTQILT